MDIFVCKLAVLSKSIVRDISMPSAAVPSSYLVSLQVGSALHGWTFRRDIMNFLLHEAVQAGNELIVNELISMGANLEAVDKHGIRPLHLAIIHSREEVLDILIAHKCDVNSITMGYSCLNGEIARLSPLYLAAESRNTTAVEALLQAGADVNAADAEVTPLQLCAYLNLRNLASLLIDRQAKVDEVRGNYSALHIAVINNNIEMADFLLSHGASVNKKELYLGASALHSAVFRREFNMVQLLVRHGADVNMRTTLMETPLFVSIERNAPEILEFLIANGARLNKGRYLQMIVARSNTVQLLEILLRNGMPLNGKTNLNESELHSITRETDKEVIQILLDHNVKFNLADKYRLYPVHYAALAGHVDAVQLLIDRGASVDCRGCNNWTPLHLAAGSSYGRLVKILLEKGADVNKRDTVGRTALNFALRGLPIFPRIFLEPGTLIKKGTPIPLVAEAARQHVEGIMEKNTSSTAAKVDVNTVATILIRNGAHIELNVFANLQKLGDVVVNDRIVSYSFLKVYTDLFKAVAENKNSLVKACLMKGAVVDCVVSKHGTPLTYACKLGSCQIVETLLAYGANPNFKMKNGMTPLHLAVIQGDVNMIISLLWKGAMYDVQHNLCRKPIYYAKKANGAFITNLLRKVEQLFHSARNGDLEVLKFLTIIRNTYASKGSDLGIDKSKCRNQLHLFFVIKNSSGENLAQVARANNNSMFVHYVWDALRIK